MFQWEPTVIHRSSRYLILYQQLGDWPPSLLLCFCPWQPPYASYIQRPPMRSRDEPVERSTEPFPRGSNRMFFLLFLRSLSHILTERKNMQRWPWIRDTSVFWCWEKVHRIKEQCVMCRSTSCKWLITKYNSVLFSLFSFLESLGQNFADCCWPGNG